MKIGAEVVDVRAVDRARWVKTKRGDDSRTVRMERLYGLHAADATRLAYLLTGDPELAQDLAHDAFIRVAGRLTALRQPEAFAPYLRRTVVNLARMHFRHQKVERAYAPRLVAPESAHDGPDPTETSAIHAALMQLPYRQRAAIVLRFYLDMPDGVVAQLLGCAEGTVRSLVSRGTSQLRDLYSQETADE